MDFKEIKCKFCGSSIKVAINDTEATCNSCLNSFKIEEPNNQNGISMVQAQQTNEQSGISMAQVQQTNEQNQPNIPNPFENLNLNSTTSNVNNTMENNINNSFNPSINNNQMPNMQVSLTPINNQVNTPTVPNVPNIVNVPPMQSNSNLVQNNIPVEHTEPVSTQPVSEPPKQESQNTPTNQEQKVNTNLKTLTVKKKKKKKNIKKILLYLFFIGVIVASGIVFYLDYTKKPDEDPNGMYDQLPSEIVVEDKDKISVSIDNKLLKLAPNVDLNEERAKYNNDEIVGRLEIPDLFNVLVAKTGNNEFYLSHDIYRKSDIRGTEFLDYRVNPTDQQINIYGHNTRDINIKVAFLKLEKFLDKEFFDANPYIVFQYDGGKALYKITAIKEIHSYNLEHMYVGKIGQEFVEHVQNMITGDGVYNFRSVPYNENSQIIVLQTCSHHWDDAFYTVIGIKVKDL